MGFLDQLRDVLRRPPGLDEPEVGELPEGLLDAARDVVFQALAASGGATFRRDYARWSDPEDLRTRLVAGWRSAASGLAGRLGVPERVGLVLAAVRLQFEARDELFRPTLLESEADRVAVVMGQAPFRGNDGWSDPVRYLVEIGALDPSGLRRSTFGDVLLRLGVREFVVALLHAEAAQSTGVDDSYRVPGWAVRALAREHPLYDPRDPTPWPDLGRFVAFGLLAHDDDGDYVYVSDRVPWLQEAANESSPLAILVRSTLDDQARSIVPQATAGPSSERAVRELAELVAHELGNALSPLDLTVGHLGGELGAEHRHVARLRAIVGKLRQFASSIDQLVPAGEPLTQVVLLDLVQDALARTASERNGHLEVSLVLTDVTFDGRRSRLRLACENLIRNAAQAARAAERRVTLTIRSDRAADSLELVFEDDGEGVPAELLETLFDRGVSGRGGSGLGLALVREIAAEHDGTVRHEPRPGGGARFVLTLRVE
jgi:signal transduction histidine kinase